MQWNLERHVSGKRGDLQIHRLEFCQRAGEVLRLSTPRHEQASDRLHEVQADPAAQGLNDIAAELEAATEDLDAATDRLNTDMTEFVARLETAQHRLAEATAQIEAAVAAHAAPPVNPGQPDARRRKAASRRLRANRRRTTRRRRHY